MVDERIKALISESLDHPLAPEDRSELDQALESSAEAREYLESLQQVDAMLAELPAEPFPDGLHDSIVSRVQLPAPAKKSWLSGLRELPGMVRYGFAAAAGLVIAIGLYEIRPEMVDPPNSQDLMGTMVPKRTGQVTVLDTFSFEQDSLSTSAALERREDELVLDLRLDAEQPVEVRIQLLGEGYSFQALAQSQPSFETFEFGDRAIRAVARGPQEFSVLLDPTGESTRNARVKLEYSSRGGLLEERELVPRQ
ncbi:MAG: hypothetical protein QNJ40_24840 [Xanthomonadales bacterium]|nr:hypothetical protein [Xanthomonadales bacterium]